MDLIRELDKRETGETGAELHRFAATLFPICRSISGDGIRETLAEIGKQIPLTLTEIPSGTAVFDWIIPREWNGVHQGCGRAQGSRLPEIQSALDELQCSGKRSYAAE
jgi:aminopeptidase-like protein